MTNLLKSRRPISSAIAAISCGCLVFGASASLQAAELEEIIVTAQKKQQRLMDVGITMTVVGEEAIRDQRIEKTTDIVLFSANTSVKENIPGLMPVVTIRGVGLNDFNAANSPAAGIYVDEVALSSLALMSTDFIDLASVEILKGPQGTLYGRNATAGALSFRTAQPELGATELNLRAGAGSYQSQEFEAMVNAPLGENLALRIAVKKNDQREGYWYNRQTNSDVGKRDELTARGQLLWQAGEDTEVLLKLESQRSRNELGSAEFWGLIPNADTIANSVTCPGSPLCSDFFGYSDNDGDPYSGDWSIDPSYEQNQTAVTLRIDHDLGFAQLTGVSGFIDFDRSYGSDIDAGPVAAVDFYNSDDVRQLSSEWRLSGQQGIADWMLGVYAAVDDVDTEYAGQLALFNTTSLHHSVQEARSKAIFANVDWALSDSLTVITGLRFSNESKKINASHQDLIGYPGGSLLSQLPYGSAPFVLAAIDDEVKDTSIEWKLGINKDLGEAALIYASVSQGTKSGGFFTGAATSQLQLQPYESETLRAFEIGVKGQSSALLLDYELSAFYYDYKDVQTFIRDNTGLVSIQRLSNVDSAKITGLDLALRWQVEFIPGLSLSSNIGTLQTELDSFATDAGPSPDGNELPDSPELSFQMALNYRYQLSDAIEASFSVDSRYQSSTYRDAVNDPLLQADSYWLSNANIKLSFANNWQISAWGKNITDQRYISQGINQISLGNGFHVYGAPRTYGLSINKYFD